MKLLYISPTMRVVPVTIRHMVALSGPQYGLGNGGNTSEESNPDPDVKEVSDVDIWEDEW